MSLLPDHLFPCPCCGYEVFDQAPGSHQVCPICGWEDDMSQLRFVRMPGGANPVSLESAQRNFADFGATCRIRTGCGRTPFEEESRDPLWRLLDASADNIEEPRSGIRYADSYPTADPTVLYYWRQTYWRRFTS